MHGTYLGLKGDPISLLWGLSLRMYYEDTWTPGARGSKYLMLLAPKTICPEWFFESETGVLGPSCMPEHALYV